MSNSTTKCGFASWPPVDGKVEYTPCETVPADEIGKRFVCTNCGTVYVFARDRSREGQK